MKKRPQMIHLGYDMPSGSPRSIPLGHLVISGMSQEAGKTSTLEALVTRSGLTAIAFVTKRGEGSFAAGHRIEPFFHERCDWEFIESILESTMKQRMKFERAWIVRACRGANSLADVRRNVTQLMTSAKRSMDQDIYMLLGEYLDKVVPLIEELPKSETLDLQPGLNVMDLLDYPEELQSLVVASVVDRIHSGLKGVVTIIPEAWKFVPQGRNTPVKVAARKLAREGAGLGNFIWTDSQDLAGVEKEILRPASVWLLGVQRELNELDRALNSIPRNVKRPKPEEIATLGLGEFFVSFHSETHRVYVQPAWMDEATAIAIAKGEKTVFDVEGPPRTEEESYPSLNDVVRAQFSRRPSKRKQAKSITTAPAIDRTVSICEEGPSMDDNKLLSGLRLLLAGHDTKAAPFNEPVAPTPMTTIDEAVYQQFKARLISEIPGVLKLLIEKPEIHIKYERPVLQLEGDSLMGRIGRIIARGFCDNPTTFTGFRTELQRTGPQVNNNSLSQGLKKFVALGFLTDEGDVGYKAVPDMRSNIKVGK
jgi:hypothetical protein